MSELLDTLSPKVMLGIAILIAAMVVGYLMVSSEQNKTDDHTTISADEYFDKMTEEKVDENFKEYLEEEKKIEESPDILSGQTEHYEWLQNAKEIDMYIPLDETAKSRDISCKITASTLTVAVKDSVVVSGEFTAAVVPAECNWQIDGEGSTRKIWISVFKAAPSAKGRYWRRVLRGDEDLNPALNKAPVYNINASDPESIKSAIDTVRGLR